MAKIQVNTSQFINYLRKIHLIPAFILLFVMVLCMFYLEDFGLKISHFSEYFNLEGILVFVLIPLIAGLYEKKSFSKIFEETELIEKTEKYREVLIKRNLIYEIGMALFIVGYYFSEGSDVLLVSFLFTFIFYLLITPSSKKLASSLPLNLSEKMIVEEEDSIIAVLDEKLVK